MPKKKDDYEKYETLRIKELDLDMISPSVKTMYNKEQGGSKIVVIGKPGCFIKGTGVLMYNGLVKKVEDVNVGDVLMGDDSTPRTVLELCKGKDEMFCVCPENEETEMYIVNKKHKLVLKNIETFEIVEISVKNYLKLDTTEKNKWGIYKMKAEFPSNSVTSPYYMGYYYLKFEEIPSNYIINSSDVRLQILAGIVDFHKDFCFKLSKTNEKLNKSLFFLVRSLGFSFEYNMRGDVYILKGPLNAIPCEFIAKSFDEQNLTYVRKFKVENIGIDTYYGFTLDGNHRFLLDTFEVVRNTGKTTLISSLLYEKSNIFPVAKVFSGTEDSNHFYQNFFPSSFVFNRLIEEEVIEFIKRQKIAKLYLDNPWAVLLIDDCTDDPKIFTKPLFHGLFKNGRHWKNLFILSLQYSLDVKPVIRTNIDGTFILRETNLRNRRVLWENYAGVIPDFNLFNQMMDELTSDYTALFINNNTTSNKLEDCVFYYKAKKPPAGFKFGCKEYWDFHKARYNEDYEDPVI